MNYSIYMHRLATKRCLLLSGTTLQLLPLRQPSLHELDLLMMDLLDILGFFV